MTPAHLVAVTEWVNWVAQATGMPSGADPESALKTRSVMMGEKYADTRMFTQASATFVAMECGLMSLPAVGILGKFLEKWWSKNKTTQPALASPGSAELEASGLSGEDRANVSIWLRLCAENVLTEREMKDRLGVIRRSAQAGYRWLLNARLDASMRAAEIAVKQGWLEAEHRWSPPSKEDVEDVARTVDPIRGGIVQPLAQALKMHTPDPQRAVAQPEATVESPPLKAYPLPPDLLVAQNPARRAVAESKVDPPAETPQDTPDYASDYAQRLVATHDHDPAEPDDDWVPSYLRVVK